MAMLETRDWLPVRYSSGLSGWGYLFGFTWDAASFYLFTPWIGVGVRYEAPSYLHYMPTVVSGAWLGWGRKPQVEGEMRYAHGEDLSFSRYCPELERYGA